MRIRAAAGCVERFADPCIGFDLAAVAGGGVLRLVSELAGDRNTTIARGRKLLFGSRIEKTAAVAGGPAGSTIALLKYGTGMPSHRAEKVDSSLGIPLPASTLWDINPARAVRAEPVFDEPRHGRCDLATP